MPSKKRKRTECPTTHPCNRYFESPPDFRHLASLYPSFKPYVFYSHDGRPRIDWTDFNATRELTRVLLHHNYNVHWWIPDGQLCPTVPNRSNYIHWIEYLLASNFIPKTNTCGDKVRGFDIGTGANCIYPLLGSSLLGWSFVGSDVTDVALEWAKRNVDSNPHISDLIEIRRVGNASTSNSIEENGSLLGLDSGMSNECYRGPLVLCGVVLDGEHFDFCMCNPPFFESMDQAGLNPKTSCGGTAEEMVCPGGEKAFITCIIEDSVALKQSFRWFTSMVGRKSNVKHLISKLWMVGVSVVKTTEFVQGETRRWGLAWSFMCSSKNSIAPHLAQKNNFSFTLEGLHRQCNAMHVLKSVESYFCACGASCKCDTALFSADVVISTQSCPAILKGGVGGCDNSISCQPKEDTSNGSNSLDELSFRISVFQQTPGTLLLRGSLLQKQSPLSGVFSSLFQKLEATLKKEFCKPSACRSVPLHQLG